MVSKKKTQPTVRDQVLKVARSGRTKGVTVAELRENHSALGHHGTLSSALHYLEVDGDLNRLTIKRDGCSVYVTPTWTKGRTTV